MNRRHAIRTEILPPSEDKHEFFWLFDRAFPKKGQQLALQLSTDKDGETA